MSKVSVLQQQDEEQVVELTRAEENALRYAAGYVCKQVSKKLKSSTDPSKQDLFLCMEMLRCDSAVDSECETSEDSSLWMDIIDRGDQDCGTLRMMCFQYFMPWRKK